jgi:hypothetical protein
MSDSRSKIQKPSSKAKKALPLESRDFVPITLANLPEPKEQFSSEGFVPSKEKK